MRGKRIPSNKYLFILGDKYQLFGTHIIPLQFFFMNLFIFTMFVMVTTITSFDFVTMVKFTRYKVYKSFVIFCTFNLMTLQSFYSNNMSFIIRTNDHLIQR